MNLDTLTVEFQLKRAQEGQSSIERLGVAKQKQIAQLSGQLAQANAELERLKGAADYAAIIVEQFRKDLEALNSLAAAAKEAERLSRESAARTEVANVGPA